ncbi:MAG TPA: hypothetical protein VND64_25690 [Pirellulales bacterium]|nr:hypothetical protein [Pirellulales bacterium]
MQAEQLKQVFHPGRYFLLVVVKATDDTPPVHLKLIVQQIRNLPT